MALAAIGRITGVHDRLEMAEAVATAPPSAQFVTPVYAISAKAGLALLAVQKGDQSEAAEHYDYLLEQKGTMIWTFSSVDRLLALLAQTMGNLDKAVEHFEDALSFSRKAGYRPELAWSCHDYAEALTQRNEPGDRFKAVSLLEESLSISTELGMPPLMERVTLLKEQTAVAPARAPAYPDGLTHREVEVLRLVASGKTSAEIAADLVLSRRTVERHISNIYNKTKARNRAEAAVYAARRGLG
jgi:DNA-binding CsgD family transcriptional regulator